LRKKEEEFQILLQETNRKHNEAIKELEGRHDKKMEELRKKAKDDLETQEKILQGQKARELKDQE